MLAEERIGSCYFFAFPAGGDQDRCECVDGRAENSFCGDRGIGQRGNGGFQEGAKTSRLEFDSKDLRTAFEQTREFAGLHAANHGGAVFKNQMNIGMGEVLGEVRPRAAKIPADHPVVSNPVSEVWRRTAASMTKLAGGERVAEDSPGSAHFRVEEFFDLACGGLSRFSNHSD